MQRSKASSESSGAEGVLTPSDLFTKEFRRAFFGGYDMAEVDGFLERVGDVMKAQLAQIRELRGRLEEYRVRQEESRQMEATLRNALVMSQKLGDDTVALAKKEAETLIAAARAEKERMAVGSAKLPVALAKEIRQLQDQRDRLRAEIRAVLSTHRVFLDSLAPAEQSLGGMVFVAEPGPDPLDPPGSER